MDEGEVVRIHTRFIPPVIPPPVSILPAQRDQSKPSIPVLDATLVEADPNPPYVEATPFQIHDGNIQPDMPWWKEHQKLISVVLLLVIGGPI